MWWHTVTHGRKREGETGEWSGYPVLFTPPRNMVYPALLPLMLTPRLPVVDWTDAPLRFKWTCPFRRKTKSGFCVCAITFQTQSNELSALPHVYGHKFRQVSSFVMERSEGFPEHAKAFMVSNTSNFLSHYRTACMCEAYFILLRGPHCESSYRVRQKNLAIFKLK